MVPSTCFDLQTNGYERVIALQKVEKTWSKTWSKTVNMIKINGKVRDLSSLMFQSKDVLNLSISLTPVVPRFLSSHTRSTTVDISVRSSLRPLDLKVHYKDKQIFLCHRPVLLYIELRRSNTGLKLYTNIIRVSSLR